MARSDLELKVLICFAEVRKNFPYAGDRGHMPLDRAIWAICGGAAGYGKKLEKVSSCGKILKILNSQNILKIPAAPAARARMTNNGNSANACSCKLFAKKISKTLDKIKILARSDSEGPAELSDNSDKCINIHCVRTQKNRTKLVRFHKYFLS